MVAIFILNITKGSNSVKTVIEIIVLNLCILSAEVLFFFFSKYAKISQEFQSYCIRRTRFEY